MRRRWRAGDPPLQIPAPTIVEPDRLSGPVWSQARAGIPDFEIGEQLAAHEKWSGDGSFLDFAGRTWTDKAWKRPFVAVFCV